MFSLIKPITWLFGIIFIIIGILGYFMHPVVGLFAVNNLHNIVHVLSGIIALVAAGMGTGAARSYLVIFGLVYAAVTIAGFLDFRLITDALMINSADNWLHLLITVIFLVVGFSSSK